MNSIDEITESLKSRFWKRIIKGETEDGCWKWNASKRRGYGRIQHKGKVVQAHRLSWQIHFGAIPDGLFVCHKCDNHECTRPDHLFLGTHADNMADRNAKGRQAKGERQGLVAHPESRLTGERHWSHIHPEWRTTGDRHWSKRMPERVPRGDKHHARQHPEHAVRGARHGNSKFSDDDIREMRKMRSEGHALRVIASKFNCTEANVSMIALRKAWKHVV